MRITRKKKVFKSVSFDICYYGRWFYSLKYTNTDYIIDKTSMKNGDGIWFGMEIDGIIPININLFFASGMWQTNVEYCEKDADGSWNHWFDPNIVCKNIKVKYV